MMRIEMMMVDMMMIDIYINDDADRHDDDDT